MSTLHIANATTQFQDFMYRLPTVPGAMPGSSGPITQRIEPGGQVRLSAKGGNLSVEDIAFIIQHHAPYGLIPVAEIGRRPGEYCPLAYSIDKPVPFAKLAEHLRVNAAVLIIRGTEARKNAAVASDERYRAEMREHGHEPNRLQALSVEVEEQEPARVLGQRSRQSEGLEAALAETPPVEVGFKVLRPTDPPPPGTKGRRRRNA